MSEMDDPQPRKRVKLNEGSFFPSGDEPLSPVTEPDNDTEIEGQFGRGKEKKSMKISDLVYNKTKRPHKKKRPPTNLKIKNYLTRDEISDAKGRLINDAKKIKSAAEKTGAKKKGAQGGTIICVIAKKIKETYPDGRYVKLCYSNLGDCIGTDHKKTAESLGYHVIKSPKMHAEMATLVHMKIYSETYELLAMGCDKDHCPECSNVMIRTMKKEEEDVIPTFSSLTPYNKDKKQPNTFDNFHMTSDYFREILNFGKDKKGLFVNRPKQESDFENFDYTKFSSLNGIEFVYKKDPSTDK